jgi:hypothetical protein
VRSDAACTVLLAATRGPTVGRDASQAAVTSPCGRIVAAQERRTLMTRMQAQLLDRPKVEWADELYELRDVTGDRVGDVIEVNPDYLVVESEGGSLTVGQHRRYYVPMASVERHAGGYHLSIGRDEVDRMAWGQPPEGSAWAGAEWQTRLRSDHPDYDVERPATTRLINSQG